jgi:mitochondrial-processing peptidase subunit beta
MPELEVSKFSGVIGVDHGELVKAAEKSFGALPVSSNPIPLSCNLHPKPDFGHEIVVLAHRQH